MSEIIDTFITNLVKRDPCKKCIVRACCGQRCNESRTFNTHMGKDVTLSRLSAWQLMITLFIIVPWLFFRMLT